MSTCATCRSRRTSTSAGSPRRRPGSSVADLANLVNEAALLAARRSHDAVNQADFTDSLEQIVLGAERQGRVEPDATAERVAYHEAGHAHRRHAHAGRRPGAQGLDHPARQALGVTFSAPDSDRFNYLEPELRAKIKVSLGGRVAEEVVFGTSRTGAESDLEPANRDSPGRWSGAGG